MKKTLEEILNFKKVTVLNLNQLNKVIGGVGGNDDDNHRTTQSNSTRRCGVQVPENGN